MATTSITHTSALNAINTMLGTIGQSPVSSLETPGLVDAVVAKLILSEITRDVLAEGWNFNTDYEYELAPDISGFIIPGVNVLRIDTSLEYRTYDVVLRGSKLWDKYKKTFVFDKAIKFDITWLLDFEDIPEAARRYITVRSSRIFQDRVMGSDTLHAYSQDDEYRARANMERNENITGNPSIFDSPDVSDIINRDYY